jgi:hypothetical protein
MEFFTTMQYTNLDLYLSINSRRLTSTSFEYQRYHLFLCHIVNRTNFFGCVGHIIGTHF